MHFGGFSEGVIPGGLYRKEDIQLLLCYILCTVNEPFPRATLVDVVVGNGLANYFETIEAIEGLLTVGTFKQDESELLTITDTGREATKTLSSRLPLTLRERSIKAAVQALARRRSERETDITVTDHPHGCTITCAIRDAEAPLMSLSLKVGDHKQADMIRERFLDNPSLLYRSILSILTGRAETNEEDGQTVINVL